MGIYDKVLVLLLADITKAVWLTSISHRKPSDCADLNACFS